MNALANLKNIIVQIILVYWVWFCDIFLYDARIKMENKSTYMTVKNSSTCYSIL